MNLKYWAFILSVIFLVVGIYLAFIREKNNIRKGTRDLQKLQADKKGGKFEVSIGIVLCSLSISVFWIAVKYLPDKQNSPPIEEPASKGPTFLDGYLFDPKGNEVGNARITVQETSDSGHTASDGRFHIPLSKYYQDVTLSVSAKGYSPFIVIRSSKGPIKISIKDPQ